MNETNENDPCAVELRHVSKRYGDFKAVNDVSLQLPAGCIYGFLGPNGAGKTTTIRMILDIIKPTEGAIRVLGHSSALEVRERIGYLPEEKGLYKKMKAWGVIAYFATLKGVARREAKKRAFALLEKYGLKDFAEKSVEALSKGMGQKVQMLASIAHEPDFVILDEPFSGLDPVNQQVMEEMIREMAQRRVTILFSTHVMQHAERLCDRILLMAKGRKVFDGTVSEAKRTLPRRVRIEAEGSIDPIRGLSEVLGVERAPGFESGGNGHGPWDFQLRDQADPQVILQACFERGIRLRSFTQTDPSLHDVFVHLVGAEAKEASFR